MINVIINDIELWTNKHTRLSKGNFPSFQLEQCRTNTYLDGEKVKSLKANESTWSGSQLEDLHWTLEMTPIDNGEGAELE